MTRPSRCHHHRHPTRAAPDGGAAAIRLGRGDLLSIKVYNAPDLSQAVRIDDRGAVSLPLLGRLEVAGLTPSELERRLETLLREGDYLVNPLVNVSVAEYATQGISVSGAGHAVAQWLHRSLPYSRPLERFKPMRRT